MKSRRKVSAEAVEKSYLYQLTYLVNSFVEKTVSETI